MEKLRLVVLAVCLLTSYLAVGWVGSRYQVEMEPPPVPLAGIPLLLGDWSGKDTEVDDATIRVMGCHSHINRAYSDSIGRELSLHAAAFTDPEYRGSAPHHPQTCYPAAGWEIVERKPLQVVTAGGEIPLELMLMRRGPERIVIAHWFESGEIKFTGSEGLQAQLTRFWEESKFPCIQKFMLQSNQPSIEAAIPILEGFVVLLQDSRLQQMSS